MNQGVLGKLTVCVLDYNRPNEAAQCVRSILKNIHVAPFQLLYLSNGGDQTLARAMYEDGRINTLVLNRENVGCGIAMKQMAAAAMTEWVMMIQCDQYAVRYYGDDELAHHIRYLTENPSVLYVDLAGNQGNGRASERAHLINRRRYLDLPGMDDVIGGPGPFAQHRWTERHVQDQGLGFLTVQPLFADNGAWSEREYPAQYGVNGLKPRTKHRTDTKRLWVLAPFGARADGFPNLNLTDNEWDDVLCGRWPTEGRIPEKDLPHSFRVWPD